MEFAETGFEIRMGDAEDGEVVGEFFVAGYEEGFEGGTAACWWGWIFSIGVVVIGYREFNVLLIRKKGS